MCVCARVYDSGCVELAADLGDVLFSEDEDLVSERRRLILVCFGGSSAPTAADFNENNSLKHRRTW